MLPHTFTVEQANALVPYLTGRFAESRRLAREIRALKAELAESEKMRTIQIDGRTITVEPDPQLGRRMKVLETELRGHIMEVLSLGVEIRRADGLVDFPAWREGRLVYLCWKYGEGEVTYWHAVGKSFEDRRPLFMPASEKKRIELN